MLIGMIHGFLPSYQYVQVDARKKELYGDPLGEEIEKLQAQLCAQVATNTEARERYILTVIA